MIASGWSATTSMRATGRPAANARRARRLELVSWVWSLRISSPTVTIAVRPGAVGAGAANALVSAVARSEYNAAAPGRRGSEPPGHSLTVLRRLLRYADP